MRGKERKNDASRRRAASDATKATNQKPSNLATLAQRIGTRHELSRRLDAGEEKPVTGLYEPRRWSVDMVSVII